MGKNGGVNFREWERYQKNLEAMDRNKELFLESCAKELAARLLAKVIKRTPVRKAEDCAPGESGGTLRKGWTSASQREAELATVFGGGSGAKTYASKLKIDKVGDVYRVEIVNPVEYASYVEFGHRTRNRKGWVRGRFMLSISEREIASSAPAILERKIQKELGECFK